MAKGSVKHNWRKGPARKEQKFDPKWQEGLCEACTSNGYSGGLPCADPRCIKGTFDREICIAGQRYRRSCRDGVMFWCALS